MAVDQFVYHRRFAGSLASKRILAVYQSSRRQQRRRSPMLALWRARYATRLCYLPQFQASTLVTMPASLRMCRTIWALAIDRPKASGSLGAQRLVTRDRHARLPILLATPREHSRHSAAG